MDLKNVLAQLREERDAIDTAIIRLERLEQSRRPGHGRPPGLAVQVSTNGANGGVKPPDLMPAGESGS